MNGSAGRKGRLGDVVRRLPLPDDAGGVLLCARAASSPCAAATMSRASRASPPSGSAGGLRRLQDEPVIRAEQLVGEPHRFPNCSFGWLHDAM